MDKWGGSWAFSWGESWGAEEDARPYPPPAGKKNRRRRFELPNGLHVYATPDEAIYIAEQFINPEAEVKVVEKKGKKLVIPQINIVLDDGESPYITTTKQKEPTSKDPFIAFTQKAELEFIDFEIILERLRRRRRIVAFLLGA